MWIPEEKSSSGTEDTNANIAEAGTSLVLLIKRKPVSEPCNRGVRGHVLGIRSRHLVGCGASANCS